MKKSVWIVGGDGWAYDIGYGGLDHVLAMNRDVNILVLDTEVYSNTGGQESKATPMGAAAKFATAGKALGKKDLGMMAMSYGHVYVARVALRREGRADGAGVPGGRLLSRPLAHHRLQPLHRARLRPRVDGCEQQKLAVDAGIWPLYRFDPRRIAEGEPPLVLDAQPTGARVSDYMKNETRFRMVEKLDPKRFQQLLAQAQMEATQRFAVYQQLAGLTIPKAEGEAERGRARGREVGGDDGSLDDLPGTPAAAPAHAGRLAAGRRPRHGPAPRGRRRRGDRDALALRGADHAEQMAAHAATSTRTPSRSPRRPPTSRGPKTSGSVPTSTSSRSARSRRR